MEVGTPVLARRPPGKEHVAEDLVTWSWPVGVRGPGSAAAARVPVVCISGRRSDWLLCGQRIVVLSAGGRDSSIRWFGGLGQCFGWLWAAQAVSAYGSWLGFGAFSFIAIKVLHASAAEVASRACGRRGDRAAARAGGRVPAQGAGHDRDGPRPVRRAGLNPHRLRKRRVEHRAADLRLGRPGSRPTKGRAAGRQQVLVRPSRAMSRAISAGIA